MQQSDNIDIDDDDKEDPECKILSHDRPGPTIFDKLMGYATRQITKPQRNYRPPTMDDIPAAPQDGRRRRQFTVAASRLLLADLAAWLALGGSKRQWMEKHTIQKSQIKRWESLKHIKLPSEAKRVGRVRQGVHPELEQRLHAWVIDHRERGFIVNQSLIIAQARRIAREVNIGLDTNENRAKIRVKFSVGWVRRFMRRWNLTYLRITGKSRLTDAEIDIAAQESDAKMRELGDSKIYTKPEQFLTMDETAVFFDAVSSYSIDVKGHKRGHGVRIRTTGNEKSRVTVILCCDAAGNKLPPAIIFPKLVKIPDALKKLENKRVCRMTVQKKG
jgi:hypothetical protein